MEQKSELKKTQLILSVGLIVNLILSAIKFCGGYFGNSKALIADSIHSLSDSITDIIIMAGVLFWTKPPDAEHPYGHRRLETITTLILGFVLLCASFAIGYDALTDLDKPKNSIPKEIALYAALLSIISKEILYRITNNFGKKIKSPALIANAWHHRLDALSSIPAFFAVAGAILLPEIKYIDIAGALIVSVFIFQASLKILWPGLEEILGKGASQNICNNIIKTAKNIPDVIDAEKLRTRYNGLKIFADLNIIVKGDISVKKGYTIAESVKKQIMKKNPDIEDIIIHVEPDKK
ncbi:MAG: cation diffusion facilitator family transporter [Desulforegulaceae bacterium]|nr:cation diffusion facilitator family transporter [Desulforegulaceae bacterium]